MSDIQPNVTDVGPAMFSQSQVSILYTYYILYTDILNISSRTKLNLSLLAYNSNSNTAFI